MGLQRVFPAGKFIQYRLKVAPSLTAEQPCRHLSSSTPREMVVRSAEVCLTSGSSEEGILVFLMHVKEVQG